MQPEEQQQPSVPTPQQAQAPLSPIAQFSCWATLEGYTALAFRQYNAVVYPGWLVLYRKQDNAEVTKIPLASDLKIKYSFGFARIAQSGGQKFGLFDKRHGFLIGPIWPYGLLMATAILDLIMRIVFFKSLPYPDEPAFWWRLASLLGVLIALFVMAVVGMPQAKAFRAACYRAAGVAS